MVLTHHAYLFIGGWEGAMAEIGKIIDEHEPARIDRQNQEVWDIADSRRLSAEQSLKSWDGRPQFFIISADSFTLPAQHALLKVLEEPAPQTHFFIVCREESDLLPTVRSRCEVRYLSPLSSTHLTWAQNFIGAAPNERLKQVAELLTQEINRAHARELADALALVCHKHLINSPTRATADESATINQARDYIADPSSSIKLIFEHLALVL